MILLSLLLFQGDSISYDFVYHADSFLKKVNLAGTFNNWDKNAWPMRADADQRTWHFQATLEPGKHLYKFVLDGDKWIADPRARTEDDGNGNTNSVLLLQPKGYDKPAKIGDGQLTSSTLKHLQEPPYLNWDKGILEIQIRCRPNDAERVELWTGSKLHKMQLVSQDELYARYSAKLPWDRTKDLDYVFALWDKKAGVNYGEDGAGSVIPFRLKAKEFKPITVPAWPERTVQYQIFPDRFENGDKSNDPSDVTPWDSNPTFRNFEGGDFAGVSKRIAYLKDLGVGAIFFNPIFEGPSNHHYETTDYLNVDHRLGTNEEFAKLTRDLKANGIKTILDGVFNHTSTQFAAFADLLAKGPDSAYKDWYYVKSFPLLVQENPTYEAWFNFPSMPKLNLANPDASAYMLNVPKFWHDQAEIAGWRLDTANEVIMDYWRRFRSTIKGLDSQMWICGEHWSNASPWLRGDQWDSVMNYPFRETMLRYVANDSISGTECVRQMLANYRMYVPQVSRNLMNLLSSHDTPRFLTLCKGDRKLQELGATLQFGWVGMPSIYYGEELGMEGGRDPENRRGTNWNLASPTNELLSFYKKLIHARNASKALQSGEPVELCTAGKTFAFARTLDSDVAIIAANRGEKPVQLDIDLKGKAPLSHTLRKRGFANVLDGGRIAVSSKGSILIRLEPKSAALLVPATSSAGSGRLLAVRKGQVRAANRQLQTANSFVIGNYSRHSRSHPAFGPRPSALDPKFGQRLTANGHLSQIEEAR